MTRCRSQKKHDCHTAELMEIVSPEQISLLLTSQIKSNAENILMELTVTEWTFPHIQHIHWRLGGGIIMTTTLQPSWSLTVGHGNLSVGPFQSVLLQRRVEESDLQSWVTTIFKILSQKRLRVIMDTLIFPSNQSHLAFWKHGRF